MKALRRSCSTVVARLKQRQTINGDLVGFVDELKIDLHDFMMVFDCLVSMNHIFKAARCRDFTAKFVRSLDLFSSSSCHRTDSMVYFVEQSFSFRGYLCSLVCQQMQSFQFRQYFVDVDAEVVDSKASRALRRIVQTASQVSVLFIFASTNQLMSFQTLSVLPLLTQDFF